MISAACWVIDQRSRCLSKIIAGAGPAALGLSVAAAEGAAAYLKQAIHEKSSQRSHNTAASKALTLGGGGCLGDKEFS